MRQVSCCDAAFCFVLVQFLTQARRSLHDQITKERDVNNFLKKHRAWLSKLKQSKTRQREESEEVSTFNTKRSALQEHAINRVAGVSDA